MFQNPSRNERRILIYSKFITVIFISWTQTLTSSIFFLIKCKWIKTKLYLFHILTLRWNFTCTLKNLGPFKYIYIYACVYSKYIQPAATTTDLHVQVSYIYFLSIDQVIFVKCLFYATPVSCLEIRLKNVFQFLFIWFSVCRRFK